MGTSPEFHIKKKTTKGICIRNVEVSGPLIGNMTQEEHLCLYSKKDRAILFCGNRLLVDEVCKELSDLLNKIDSVLGSGNKS